MIHFLDTRGLGEPGYDYSEDVKLHEEEANVLMLAIRVSDPDQADILKIAAKVRRSRPLPIVAVHTCLHEGYDDNAAHNPNYPFTGSDDDVHNPAIKRELRNQIAFQRAAFKEIKGEPPLFVAVDFNDDFKPSDYGKSALVRATVRAVSEAKKSLSGDRELSSRFNSLRFFSGGFLTRLREARNLRMQEEFNAALGRSLNGNEESWK
jgi:hypothetical protein